MHARGFDEPLLGSSMSLLNLLNIGSIGASAGQAGVNVAATNLSNIATEGYNRRSAAIRPEVGSRRARRAAPWSVRGASLLSAQSSPVRPGRDRGVSHSTRSSPRATAAWATRSTTSRPPCRSWQHDPGFGRARAGVGQRQQRRDPFQNAAAARPGPVDSNERVRGVSTSQPRLQQVGALSTQINKSEIAGRGSQRPARPP